MNIQVLISTMNCQDGTLLAQEMGLSGNYVIINQVTKTGIEPKDFTTASRKFLSFSEKGLSKSRNKAIQNSTADVCVIADDDMYYETDYEATIAAAYEKYPDADAIAFYVANEDPNARSKEIKAGRVGLINSMRLSSVRLTFKKSSLIQKEISFNENFGAGAAFYSGEENIFLAECLKKGMKIYYVPKKIATLRLDTASTWFAGYNEYFFNVKGLTFYYISRWFYPLLVLQFAVRKRKLYAKDIPMLQAIRAMFAGVKNNKPKKDVYFAGDFVSNTGPANVNKKYRHFLQDSVYACASNSKPVRIVHFLSKILFADKVIVSGVSKFHLDVVKISKTLHKEVFYLMHGYSVIENELNGVSGQNDRLAIEQGIIAGCDTIICVSQNFADFMKANQPALAHKITYVNNGVELPETQHASRPTQTAAANYNLISVGGGMPRKNNLAVCQAIAALGTEQIHFTVIGAKGRDGDAIAVFPFVDYYEALSQDEVLQKMRQADAYVQNSSFETFGLAVCEALGQGCDLLVSKNVGAISVLTNLAASNIINDPTDIQEIAAKIKQLIARKPHTISFMPGADWQHAAGALMQVVRGGEDVAQKN